ncbi:zinc finger protein Dzip1 isoform X2 [Coregonus clupeaformis]|uniref:zinc finger protein Dzip1 isoform X2 n=1 Tax=Coregonus clupeaformis TaxID=59861 RepID=UPI001E1C5C77|nr:zinc finger protein Dzip1 isoform X2 [Coregonus clupeaformis]
MPFYNNVYYPYQPETQGTHSSAGIPSLLNSPLSQPSSSSRCPPAPAMSASTSTTIPPFKFRPRRESVDWRRISVVDVDLVASELDFQTLQEHITGVTFCNVEGERCVRCQSPVDPALLKLFRLAQLTVEYLLHSQEYLTLSLGAAEERLQTQAREHQQLLAQQQKQADQAKALKTELKQRKKIIALNQQAMINMTNCHKNHMQRRHPDEYDSQLRTGNQRKVKSIADEEEISRLKGQLSKTTSELESQKQALLAKASQERDQQSMHQDWMRKLERWKEEEHRKIEEMRDGFRREIEMLHNQNALLQQKVDLQRTNPERRPSPAPQQTDQDMDEKNKFVVQKMDQKHRKLEERFTSKIEKMKANHESEKNQWQDQFSRLESSVVEWQQQSQREKEESGQRLQERDLIILSQREQIKHMSSNPPTKVVEVPVIITAPAPEPKPKRVVNEQPPSAPKLDPIEELSEEDKDWSSVSEKKPVVKKQPSPVTSVLRKNPNIKRELRPALEQALLEKLESLGVKPGLRGLRGSEYSDIMAKVRSERESAARDIPDYWRHREDVTHTLRLRLKDKRTGSDSAPEQRVKPKQPTQVTQARQRSSSLSSKVTQVMSGPPAAPAKQLQTTPQPAPRTLTSTLPKTTLPKTSTPKTPPFSSDDESSSEEESEEEEEEEPPHKPRQEQRVPHHRASQPKPTQPKTTPHHKLTQSKPVQARSSQPKPVQPRTTQAQPSKPQQPRSTAVNTTKTAVTVVESEGEWTEGSELEEIDTQQLQNYKDQNGNVQKTTNNNLVKDLTKSLEKQLADRGPKKPLGGVSTLPEWKDKDVVRELKYTNEEDEDDWDISSLDDLSVSAPVGKPTAPVRKSLDSNSTTSVWGTSTGKGQKTGLNEAGTGSTLKSSLVSVSDWSDDDV